MLDRQFRSVFVLFVTVVIAGCNKPIVILGPPNPLVGKWTLTQNALSSMVTIVREFKSDGTETMTSIPPGQQDVVINYTINGSTLTETVTSMTVDGRTVHPAPPAPGGPQGQTSTFALSGNTLTLTYGAGGPSQPYTRTR